MARNSNMAVRLVNCVWTLNDTKLDLALGEEKETIMINVTSIFIIKISINNAETA